MGTFSDMISRGIQAGQAGQQQAFQQFQMMQQMQQAQQQQQQRGAVGELFQSGKPYGEMMQGLAQAAPQQYGGQYLESIKPKAFDFERLAQEAFALAQAGQPLTPEHEMAVEMFDAFKNREQMMDAEGNIVPQQRLLGDLIGGGSEQMVPPVTQGQMFGQDQLPPAQLSGPPGQTEGLTPPPELSPKARLEYQKQAIGEQMGIRKEQREAKVKEASRFEALQTARDDINYKVLPAIQNARELIKRRGTSGFQGWATQNIGGFPAFQLEQALEPVRSSQGIGTLIKMKESSPSGSTGFGALSAPELNLVLSTATSLKLGQSDEQLLKALDKLEGLYAKQMTGIESGVSEIEGNNAPLGQTKRNQGLPEGVTMEDIEFTAKKHKMTIGQVKKRMGIQ